MDKVTPGVIVGNRGFFPGYLCETGSQEVLRVLAEEGVGAITLDTMDSPFFLVTDCWMEENGLVATAIQLIRPTPSADTVWLRFLTFRHCSATFAAMATRITSQ